jgi:hypothetical protein
MDARDQERLQRMAKEAEERATANAAKKKRAEQRIAGTTICNPRAHCLHVQLVLM